MNIFEDGFHELSDYVTAVQMMPILKAKREEVFKSFYEDCTSFYLDDSLGFMRKVTFSVEEAAIMVIERKQEYDNLLQRTERKSKMIENTLQNLTPMEQESFYQNCTNNPSNPIVQKVCKSIHNQQLNHFNEKVR